jgi:hypothetical protein
MSETVKSMLGGAEAEPSGVVDQQVVGAAGDPVASDAGTGAGENGGVSPGTFDFSKVVGTNGELAANWRDALPENLRGEKCLENIKHFGALAQSYIHGQRAIGANKIAVPGKDATPEEQAAFFEALGRPKQAEDYKFEVPEALKDAVDHDGVTAFRKFAYEHGLSQEAFSALVQYDLDRATKAGQADTARLNAEYDATETALKEEYGDKVPDFVAQAKRARDTFGLGEVLAKHGLQNNLAVLKALHKIGGSLSESKLHGEDKNSIVSDPAARIAEITGNLDDPYYKADHPLHAQRVQEMEGLLKQQQRATKAAGRG